MSKSYELFADVSSNNGQIDIPHYSRAGHVLIAIKATQGDNYTNPDHLEQCNIAHEFGLTVLHYHFSDLRDSTPQSEINHFRDIYNKAWRDGDKTCFDIEDTEYQTPEVQYANNILKKYYLQSSRMAALYSNRDKLLTTLAGVKVPGDKIWEADYNFGSPFDNWAKQYTNGETGPEPHFYSGIGKCDGSMIHKPEAVRCYIRKIRTRKRK